MIVPVMAISNLVLTRQIYFEETNGAHAHYREPVPLIDKMQGYRVLSAIGYKHFPEYIFNFVRFYVIIHQNIDLKRSNTYKCPFYWESEAFNYFSNKQEKKLSQVADRKGNDFIVEKNRIKLLCFFAIIIVIYAFWHY